MESLLSDQISELLRESSEQLRFFIEALPHSVSIHQDGRIVFVNRAMSQMFDIDDPDEMLRYDPLLFVPANERDKLADFMRRRLDNQEVPQRYRTTFLRSTGGEFPAEVMVNGMSFYGRPAIMYVIIDNTERVQAEQAAKWRSERDALTACIAARFLGLEQGVMGVGIEAGMSELGHFIDADRGFLYRIEADGQSARREQQWFRDTSSKTPAPPPMIDLTALPHLTERISSLKPAVVSDLDILAETSGEATILRRTGVKSLLAVPLVHRSSAIGFLGFSWMRQQKDLGEEIVNFVTTVANVLAAALARGRAEEEVRRRLEIEKVLSVISAKLLSPKGADMRRPIEEMLRILGQFADADRAFVYELNPDRCSIQATFEWWTAELEAASRKDGNLPIAPEYWGMERLVGNNTLIIPRVADLQPSDAKAKARLVASGIKSIVVLGMAVGGDNTGYLGLCTYRSERQWPDDIVSLLRTVSGTVANAIERRHAEEALRLSEVRFRTLVSALPDAVVEMNLEAGLTYASSRALDLFGLTSPEEVVGRSALDFIVREEGLRATQNLARLRQDGIIQSIEYTMLRALSSRFVAELSTALIRDGDGTPKSIVGIIRDVTYRRVAEKRETRHKEDLDFLSRTAMDFVRLDLEDDIYEYIGERIYELFAKTAIVAVTAYDNELLHFTLKSIHGLSPIARGYLRHTCDLDPANVSGQFSQRAYDMLLSGRFQKLPGGFVEICQVYLPSEIAKKIEEQLGLGEVYVVGFQRSGKIFGGVVLIQQEKTTELNHEILTAFVGQAAVAIERRRAQEEVTQQNWELATLNTLAALTGRLLDVDLLIEKLLDELNHRLGLAVSIWLFEEGPSERPRLKRTCRLVGHRGYPSDWVIHASELSTLGELMPDRELSLQLEKVSAFDQFPPSLRRIAQREAVESCLVVPLGIGQDIPGYLLCCATSQRNQLCWRPGFLGALGHQIGLAIRNAKLYGEANDHRRRLSLLADQLSTTEEEERRKTAREVHDQVSQPLGLARMLLTAAQSTEETDSSQEKMNKASELLATAIGELRRITLDLHPPVLDSFGVGSAIESAVEDFIAATGITVEIKIEYRAMEESSSLRAFLLRAAKELLVNVAKHGEATKVSVALRRSGENLVLRVSDNGKGFEVNRSMGKGNAPKGIGLIALEERSASFGGNCRLISNPGKGTRAELVLPIDSSRSKQPQDKLSTKSRQC
jgi:PAS domain S-box-containing protein